MGQGSNTTTQEIDPDIKERQLDLYNQSQLYNYVTPWQQYPGMQVGGFQPLQLAGQSLLANSIYGPGAFNQLGFQQPQMYNFQSNYQWPEPYVGSGTGDMEDRLRRWVSGWFGGDANMAPPGTGTQSGLPGTVTTGGQAPTAGGGMVPGTTSGTGGIQGYPGMFDSSASGAYSPTMASSAVAPSFSLQGMPISVDNGQGGSTDLGPVVGFPPGGGPGDPGSPDYNPGDWSGVTQNPDGTFSNPPPSGIPGPTDWPGQIPGVGVSPYGPGAGGFQVPGFNIQNAIGLGDISRASQAAGLQAGMTPSSSPFYNQFTNDVINTQFDDLNRARQMALSDIGSSATQAGAFGGDRQALLEAETNRGFFDTAGRLSAQLRSQGFDTAQQLAQQNAQRQLQASGLYGGLGSMLQQGVYGAANQLMGAGNQQQALAQGMIDRNLADFYQARNFPIQGFQLQQGILQGMPAGYSTTTPGGNFWSGLAGAGLTLGGAALGSPWLGGALGYGAGSL